MSRPLRDAAGRLALRGEAVQCPMCSSTFARFGRFNGRPNARCHRCGGLERHRLLWLYLEQNTDLFTRPQRVLHIAPEVHLQQRLRSVHGTGYVYGDIADPHHRIDVTAIAHPDDSFDVAICSHVLEHVPDDEKAVRELARVLTRTGWAILDAPVDEGRAETYCDPSISSPTERRTHFGQWDHVRVYGRDYTALLQRGGFEVEMATVGLDEVDARRHGLRPTKDRIYLCRLTSEDPKG